MAKKTAEKKGSSSGSSIGKTKLVGQTGAKKRSLKSVKTSTYNPDVAPF